MVVFWWWCLWARDARGEAEVWVSSVGWSWVSALRAYENRGEVKTINTSRLSQELSNRLTIKKVGN